MSFPPVFDGEVQDKDTLVSDPEGPVRPVGALGVVYGMEDTEDDLGPSPICTFL